MSPETSGGKDQLMQDHEEHNSWLEEQAARGAADRAAMVDRSSAATERERAICCARRSKATGPGCSRTRARSRRHGGDRPRRARGLHARQVGRDRQRPRGHHSIRRGERPTGIARRDARGQGRSRRPTRRSQSTATPEGSLAVDHPASPVNQRLNAALAEDLRGRVSVSFTRGYSARLESGLSGCSPTLKAGRLWRRTRWRRGRGVRNARPDQRRGRCRDRLRRSLSGTPTRSLGSSSRRALTTTSSRPPTSPAVVRQTPAIDNQLDVLTRAPRDRRRASGHRPGHARSALPLRRPDAPWWGGRPGRHGTLAGRTRSGRAAAAANAAADGLNAVRNVLQTQRGIGRAADGAVERRYEPPAAGPSTSLER